MLWKNDLLVGCRHNSVDSFYVVHTAASGSSPKHTITLLSFDIWFVSCRNDENKQKEAGMGPL